jgi:hypothetical protein
MTEKGDLFRAQLKLLVQGIARNSSGWKKIEGRLVLKRGRKEF